LLPVPTKVFFFPRLFLGKRFAKNFPSFFRPLSVNVKNVTRVVHEPGGQKLMGEPQGKPAMQCRSKSPGEYFSEIQLRQMLVILEHNQKSKGQHCFRRCVRAYITLLKTFSIVFTAFADPGCLKQMRNRPIRSSHAGTHCIQMFSNIFVSVEEGL
jgi:hypothetical protein